jgi:galactosamine-6-phosphate isomerase
MSGQAADFIVKELREKPDLLLCASSGRTPMRAYELLAAAKTKQRKLFQRLRVIKIDEWAGLAPDHQASCELYLKEKLIDPLGIDANRYISFSSDARDPHAECERISAWLAEHGPIDVCVLGLGENGHVALNEPAASLWPHAYVVRLAKRSLQHPMLAALKHKPTRGLTLGMGEILQSRRILLLVSGGHKRAVLRRLLKPLVSTRFPASLLWLHPDVTILSDRDSGGWNSPSATIVYPDRGSIK